MVIKQPNTSKAPEMDEAWWTALLADEEKYKNAGTRESALVEDLEEQEEHTARKGLKTSEIDWEKVRKLFSSDQVINLEVTGFNRGGLLVAGNGLHGFVPVSHLLEISCLTDEKGERDHPGKLCGENNLIQGD